ncbi:MAG: ATP-binding cassette domain-containing protein [Caulobacteraceae bacterium]
MGPNGAGKSTALNAILGLTQYEGDLKVLGRDPWVDRDVLMRDVCFIADVAVLPRWMKVSQAVDYVEGVHPRFDRARAEAFLARTDIKPNKRVGQLSKGMVTQLHLALVMAIDARLLVLDEPTPGPRPALPQAVLRQPAERLLRPQPHHRGDHPPGRGGAAHPHRPRLHPVRPHRPELQHGGVRAALPRGDGRAREPRRRAGLGPHQRAPGVRPQHPPLRQRPTRAARHARGRVHTASIADLFVAVMGGAPAKA